MGQIVNFIAVLAFSKSAKNFVRLLHGLDWARLGKTCIVIFSWVNKKNFLIVGKFERQNLIVKLISFEATGIVYLCSELTNKLKFWIDTNRFVCGGDDVKELQSFGATMVEANKSLVRLHIYVCKGFVSMLL